MHSIAYQDKKSYYPSWGLFPPSCRPLCTPVTSLIPFFSPSPLHSFLSSDCERCLITCESPFLLFWRKQIRKGIRIMILLWRPDFWASMWLGVKKWTFPVSSRRAQTSDRCCLPLLWPELLWSETIVLMKDVEASAESIKMVHSDSIVSSE